MKYPCVYIVTNHNHTVLYVGVTSFLLQRIYQHKNHSVDSFTDRYNCSELVYYEFFDTMDGAIEYEKKLKHYKRAWKEDLINKFNPTWKDCYDDIVMSYPYN